VEEDGKLRRAQRVRAPPQSRWQFALSAAVSVACTAGLARGAIAVCRTSILQTGRRVLLRELIAR
jgi:hypothetical protein